MAADDREDALKKHRDLLIACGWGKEVDVILLFQQGASVRVQDQDGKNCLHYSACKGHIQVTNLLIEHGCAINAKDKCQRTPLHLAAEEGHNDIVSILLDNGAEVDVQDEDGYTPCHMACLNDHAEVLELLIHIKADLNVKSQDGLTPLHIASLNSSLKSIGLLVKAGVCTSSQDTQGNVPVHLAVQAKSLKSLKCLIKHEANINMQNYDGDTALHLCADLGYVQFAECILNCNQPVELSPNNVGDTAKDIAIRHGFREIVQIIPDPSFRKKKPKRRQPNSPEVLSSPLSVPNSVECGGDGGLGTDSRSGEGYNSANTTSPGDPVEEVTLSPHTKHKYQSSILGSPPGFLQHPSEEVPTATSSSLLSLWVPTTDSGISLPMDSKIESNAYPHRRKQKKAVDKSAVPPDQKTRHRKNDKIQLIEYDELRHDPRFLAPSTTVDDENSINNTLLGKGTPRRTTPKVSPRGPVTTDRRQPGAFTNGTVSDESVQVKGCFFKTNKKNHASVKSKKHSLEHDKDYVMQRQKELQHQLSESKVSLEKQMRRMRKKFEKAILATDHRFLEQQKREENFHNQLRTELEMIEHSLEKGSKKNVVEFTNHIKGELNRLTEKLGTLDLYIDDDATTEYSGRGSTIRRRHHKSSAVDLDKDISVSLSEVDTTSCSRRPKGADSATSEQEERIRQSYEQRLKQLEAEVRQKAEREKENEELRARVLELEQLVKGDHVTTQNAVT